MSDNSEVKKMPGHSIHSLEIEGKPFDATNGDQMESFSTWKSQIEDVRSKMKPRFTVVPVTINNDKDRIQIRALDSSRNLQEKRREPDEGSSLLSLDDAAKAKESDSERTMSLSPANSPPGAAAAAAAEHYHILNGVPASLVPVVLPRGTCIPSKAIPQKSSSPNLFSHLGVIPHGATIPPLHETMGNHHHLVLNKLLKESKRNIEYGTSDGKTLKVFSSKTSSQLLESGSIFDPRPCSRGERRHPYYGNDERGKGRSRPNWRSKLEFVLSCIGACVGFGSFWRLPYLCLVFGRVAFLVPYFIIFFLGGMPLLLAELVLGQFTQWGPIEAMKRICPLMQGVGIGLLVISLFSSVYYSLIFSESILSLGIVLGEPFLFCNTSEILFCTNEEMVSLSRENLTDNVQIGENVDGVSILDHNDPKTEALVTLLVTLIGSWLVVYFALWKSVSSIGKVTKVSATVPFILISAFAWRALTLPGATVGLQYLFKPQWNILTDGQVWVNAGVQVLISLNIVFGSSIAFASYNKFWNNVTTDVWVISVVSCLSSLLAVLVVFSGIGNIAFESGLAIEDIDFEGADLAFVVYPQILSKMPQKHLWAALFFLLLILLGLDSQFASVEVIVTSVKDRCLTMKSKLKFQFLKKYFSKHETLVLSVCVICFLCSLPSMVQANALFDRIKNFEAMNVAILFLALCETTALGWLYGTQRLSRSILIMTAKPPSQFYLYCWKILTPILFLALWITSWMCYELPDFHNNNGNNQLAAVLLGWFFAAFSILPVPICALMSLCEVEGGSFRERLTKALTPEIETYPSCSRPMDEKKRFGDFFHCFTSCYPKKKTKRKTKIFLEKRASAPL